MHPSSRTDSTQLARKRWAVVRTGTDPVRDLVAHPTIVVSLEVVNSCRIVGKNLPVLRPEPIVICRFAQGVDDIIDRAVIPHALIQLCLQRSQLFSRPVQAMPLSIGGRAGAVDVIQIVAHACEHMSMPTLAAEICITIVMPVPLRESDSDKRD